LSSCAALLLPHGAFAVVGLPLSSVASCPRSPAFALLSRLILVCPSVVPSLCAASWSAKRTRSSQSSRGKRLLLLVCAARSAGSICVRSRVTGVWLCSLRCLPRSALSWATFDACNLVRDARLHSLVSLTLFPSSLVCAGRCSSGRAPRTRASTRRRQIWTSARFSSVLAHLALMSLARIRSVAPFF
jgi:hypothetical protein